MSGILTTGSKLSETLSDREAETLGGVLRLLRTRKEDGRTWLLPEFIGDLGYMATHNQWDAAKPIDAKLPGRTFGTLS